MQNHSFEQFEQFGGQDYNCFYDGQSPYESADPPPSPASKEITSSWAPIRMMWTLDPAILLRERSRSMASAADALGRQKSLWAFGPRRLRRPSR